MARNYLKIMAFFVALFCVSCTGKPDPLRGENVSQVIQQDIHDIYPPAEVLPASLTLEQAVARALRYNLDAKVSLLEEMIAKGNVDLQALNVLPTTKLSYQYIGRSNEGSSASRSVSTGQQSLEPSVSTEPQRTVAKLEARWNLLDAVITLFKTSSAQDEAQAATERRRKVLQNIAQDTYVAFWRAVASQALQSEAEQVLAEAQAQAVKIDKALKEGVISKGEGLQRKKALMERQKELRGLQQQFDLAELELKVLTAIPPGHELMLDPGGKDWLAEERLPKVEADADQLQKKALRARPEIREEILNQEIAVRDIEMEVLRTFPGLEAVIASNKDNNKYLTNKNWASYSLDLVQSISNVITLPTRHEKAEHNLELANFRRKALVAAVITQVHVAKRRFDSSLEEYELIHDLAEQEQQAVRYSMNLKKAGTGSGSDLLDQEMTALAARYDQVLAYTEVQDAYARLLNAIGQSYEAPGVPNVDDRKLSDLVKLFDGGNAS